MDVSYEIIKIAHYYYNLEYNQQEIADRLNMSRQRVNRLLKKAMDEGVVEIQVHGYKDSNVELESKLESRFNLLEARVVNQGNSNEFGNRVISYLETIIDDGTNVGVTFGSTLSQICTVSSARIQRDINVVQLLGGVNTNNVEFKPDEIANRFAKLFGGTAYSLYIPAIVDNLKLKELIAQEEGSSKIFEMYKDIDIALVAIGATREESILIRDHYLKKSNYEELVNKKAVGDVCFRFLDINGEIVDQEFNKRVTGISTSDLKHIPFRIGAAYGKHKIKAIIAAINGGYINVLITDVQTARLLLEFKE